MFFGYMLFKVLGDSNLFNGKLSTVYSVRCPSQPFGKPLLNKTTCPRDLSFPNVQLFIFDPPLHYTYYIIQLCVSIKMYNVFFPFFPNRLIAGRFTPVSEGRVHGYPAANTSIRWPLNSVQWGKKTQCFQYTGAPSILYRVSIIIFLW